MKKSFLILANISPIFLISCRSTNNSTKFGKEIWWNSEFNDRTKYFKYFNELEDNILQIDTSGYIKSDVPGNSADYSLNSSLSTPITLKTYEEMLVLQLISSFNVTYIREFIKQPAIHIDSKNYYVSDKESLSFVVKGNLTQYVRGGNSKGDYVGQFTWNKYGLIEYAFEKAEQTIYDGLYGSHSVTYHSLTEFSACYTFK